MTIVGLPRKVLDRTHIAKYTLCNGETHPGYYGQKHKRPKNNFEICDLKIG